MKLKDFVSETLKEIVDGAVEAQKYYVEKGGSVNSKNLSFRTDQDFQMWDGNTGQPAQLIEFDVAVTTTEGTETKGGIGVRWSGRAWVARQIGCFEHIFK